MTHIHSTRLFALLALIALTSSAALAQDRPPSANPSAEMKDQSAMHDMKGMDNMHDMSAKVDAIDHKTGIVDVTTSGMKLKVHFPPATLADVKAGDTITLHLGFSK